MAKAGAPSQATRRGSDRSDLTRQALVAAAIDALKENGYSGASPRGIAQRAGVNQGLVFHHFGSVANLLPAALDAVSDERLRRYGADVTVVPTPSQLVDTAEGIFKSDLDAGYITVLVEMIAGSTSTPRLGPEVASRIDRWRDFAQSTIERSVGDSPLHNVLPTKDLAHTTVARSLGLEMLSHLQDDTKPALALFAHARHLASLLEGLTAPAGSEGST